MSSNERVETLDKNLQEQLAKLNKNIELLLPLCPQSKVINFLIDQTVAAKEGRSPIEYGDVDVEI
jgi:hypothetical protein